MNKLKVFQKVFIANLKEFYRDRSSIFWMIAFPLIFTFIFGLVFSGGNQATFSIGISSGQSTPITERLVEEFRGIPTFRVSTGSLDDELDALKEGNRRLVLELPAITRSDLEERSTSEINVYYSKGEGETNRALLSAVKDILSGVERSITGERPLFTLIDSPLETRELTQFDYVMPGILAMALMQLGLFGVFQFMSLRENKVIRGLAVTPLPREILFESEVALRLLVAIFQTFLIVVVGRLVFGVELVGNLFLLAGLVFLGAGTFVSMGYMLASFTRSLEGGRNLIQTVQFPMMFLSGIFFPIEIMPGYIRPVVRAIPLTYLGDALRQVMVGFPPEYSLRVDVLVLSVWLIFSAVLAIRYWKWE